MADQQGTHTVLTQIAVLSVTLPTPPLWRKASEIFHAYESARRQFKRERKRRREKSEQSKWFEDVCHGYEQENRENAEKMMKGQRGKAVVEDGIIYDYRNIQEGELPPSQEDLLEDSDNDKEKTGRRGALNELEPPKRTRSFEEMEERHVAASWDGYQRAQAAARENDPEARIPTWEGTGEAHSRKPKGVERKEISPAPEPVDEDGFTTVTNGKRGCPKGTSTKTQPMATSTGATPSPCGNEGLEVVKEDWRFPKDQEEDAQCIPEPRTKVKTKNLDVEPFPSIEPSGECIPATFPVQKEMLAPSHVKSGAEASVISRVDDRRKPIDTKLNAANEICSLAPASSPQPLQPRPAPCLARKLRTSVHDPRIIILLSTVALASLVNLYLPLLVIVLFALLDSLGSFLESVRGVALESGLWEGAGSSVDCRPSFTSASVQTDPSTSTRTSRSVDATVQTDLAFSSRNTVDAPTQTDFKRPTWDPPFLISKLEEENEGLHELVSRFEQRFLIILNEWEEKLLRYARGGFEGEPPTLGIDFGEGLEEDAARQKAYQRELERLRAERAEQNDDDNDDDGGSELEELKAEGAGVVSDDHDDKNKEAQRSSTALTPSCSKPASSRATSSSSPTMPPELTAMQKKNWKKREKRRQAKNGGLS
ncbi:MAG: hypothetical protein M1831_004346 [Alyxoria varia]|nr:MAG: hypothetical protein M1831_004346 [Alyxoria varia]